MPIDKLMRSILTEKETIPEERSDVALGGNTYTFTFTANSGIIPSDRTQCGATELVAFLGNSAFFPN